MTKHILDGVLNSLKDGKPPNLEPVRGDEHPNLYADLTPIPENTAQMINYIFERLSGVVKMFRYQAEFEISLDSIRREYTYALMRSGIKEKKDIDKAINRIADEGCNFIPTPAEFISMCKPTPQDIGAPSVDDAYAEACRNARPSETNKIWTHPAIRYAFNYVGSYNLTHESKTKTFIAFEKSYLEACDMASRGELKTPLPAPDAKEKGEHRVGKYDFVRPGILRQYEHISSRDEAMAEIDNLLGKGNSGLRRLVDRLGVKERDNG